MHLSDLDLLSALLVLLTQQLGYGLSLLIAAVSVKYIQVLFFDSSILIRAIAICLSSVSVWLQTITSAASVKYIG